MNQVTIFSVCDGLHLLSYHCLVTRSEVDLQELQVVRITSWEEVKEQEQNVYLGESGSSSFQKVVAMVEVEVVEEGSSLGHFLWDRKACRELTFVMEDDLNTTQEIIEEIAVQETKEQQKVLWHEIKEPGAGGDLEFLFPCGTALKAHRRVVQEASEVFDTHLGKEGVYCDQEQVRIVDCRPDVFRRFLAYIYGQNPQLRTMETTLALLYLGEKYLMAGFQKMLRAKVQEHLVRRPVDALEVQEMNRTQDKEVQEILLGAIDSNMMVLVGKPETLAWDLETVLQVLLLFLLFFLMLLLVLHLFLQVLSRASLSCPEHLLVSWLLLWCEQHTPREQEGEQLAALIRWKELQEQEVFKLLVTPRASCLLPLARLEQVVAMARLRGLMEQEAMSQETKSLARAPTLRSSTMLVESSRQRLPPGLRERLHPSPLVIPLHCLHSSPQTSLPVLLCPDGDTLVQPNLKLALSAMLCYESSMVLRQLELELRVVGGLGGLPDTSVTRYSA